MNRCISLTKWRGLQFLRSRRVEQRVVNDTFCTTWERVEGLHSLAELKAWYRRHYHEELAEICGEGVYVDPVRRTKQFRVV